MAPALASQTDSGIRWYPDFSFAMKTVKYTWLIQAVVLSPDAVV